MADPALLPFAKVGIMTHDPLCPTHNCIDSNCSECCECDLIAKVKADERRQRSRNSGLTVPA